MVRRMQYLNKREAITRILFILLLCSFLFSLCSCDKATVELSPETTAAQPKQADDPTEPIPVAELETAVFSLKSLPDIGKYVSDEKKDFFFDDGVHDVFEPRDDYGEVVPYFSHTAVYREVPSYTYTDDDGSSSVTKVENRSLFYGNGLGLMTRDGRIISAPTYDYFESYTDLSRKKIWVFGTENPEEMYSFAPTVIAGDGSWKLEFPENYSIESLNDLQHGCFIVRIDEGNEYTEKHLYSFDGVLLADLDQIRAKYETKEERLALKAVEDDKLLFQFYDPRDNDDNDYYEEEEMTEGQRKQDNVYFYTDMKGEKLSDLCLSVPYDEKRGNCIIGYDGIEGIAQLFKMDGTPLTKGDRGYCHYDQAKQLILIYNKETNIVTVYNTNGELVDRYEMDWDFFQYSSNGAVFLDKEQHKLYNISDGGEISLNLPDIEIIETVYETINNYESGDMYIAALTETGRCYLFDLNGNQVACVNRPDATKEEYDYVYYNIDLFVSPAYVLSVSKTSGWYVFDRAQQQERKLPLDGIPVHWEEGMNEHATLSFFGDLMSVYYSYIDDDTGERSRTDLYDLKTGHILYSDLIYTDQTDDLFLFTTKRAAVVLEKDGSVLLKMNTDTLF